MLATPDRLLDMPKWSTFFRVGQLRVGITHVDLELGCEPKYYSYGFTLFE